MNIESAVEKRAGRPKSEEKADAILCSAGDLFLAQGFQSTSMDAVAAAAGVSKQTVYSHFQNKEDLFRAVILAKVKSYELSEEAMPEGLGVREALLSIGRRSVDLLFDPEVVAMFRVVIGESASYPKLAELFYESGAERKIQALKGFLEAQVAAGVLKVDDYRYAASQFFNMVGGEYHMRLLMNLGPVPTDEQKQTHVERTVDQFLQLYAP